jgi:shikimate dehydrogenase
LNDYTSYQETEARWMVISGKTQLVGLIGWPVAHSFSPVMHNAAIAALGLNWVYVPLPVRPSDVAPAVGGLAALGFRGVNVTVPHKQAVIPFLDEIDIAARAIRAVNTIVVERAAESEEESARLIGYNTDWAGFLADLQTRGVEIGRRDCLVLGAGGSARSLAYALLQAGGRVQVLARRAEQAQQVALDLAPHVDASRLSGRPLSELQAVVRECTAPLIVNTTPLGMTPDVDASPWPDNVAFPQNAFIYDLVYNPTETKFMRQAQAAGCRTTNGLGMLLYQGALALELWTGQKSDTAVMVAALSMDSTGVERKT